MKEIPLTHGKVALVDDSDFDCLSQYNWFYRTDGKREYAVRNTGKTKMLMHVELLGKKASLVIDHINGNGLDNQRCNLRHVSQSINVINSRKRPGISKYRGVRYDPRHPKAWRAALWLGDRWLSLKYHNTEEEAARAVDRAALEHRGEFAVLNFPVNSAVIGRVLPA